MGVASDVDQMRLATVAQAHKMMTDRLAARPERWQTVTDDAGRMFRRNLDTGKMELITGALEPGETFISFFDEYGRRIKRNLVTGEETQVGGEVPLTFEQRKELARTGQEREWNEYIYQDEKGEYAVGLFDEKGNLQKKLRDATSRDLRAGVEGELPWLRFEHTVAKDVAVAERTLMDNKDDPQYKSYVEFINSNSVGPTGYVWVDEVRKGPAKDIHEAIPVQLPKVGGVQVTMVEIRAIAARRGVSVEEVLKEYRERAKPK